MIDTLINIIFLAYRESLHSYTYLNRYIDSSYALHIIGFVVMHLCLDVIKHARNNRKVY